jgi:hypothetical protein
MRAVLSLLALLLIPIPANAQCAADEECKAGRFCLGGLCREWAGECFKDVDCEGDLLCERGRCSSAAAPSTVGAAAAVEAKPAAAAPAKADPNAPFWARVGTFDREATDKISRRLSSEFEGKGFYLSYKFLQTRDDDEHEFVFSDLGFYFRFDIDKELKIKGEESDDKTLRSWREDDDDGPNEVQVWFDGRRILIDANGERLGPIEVSDKDRREVGRWKVSITGSKAEIQDLVVKAWDGSLE